MPPVKSNPQGDPVDFFKRECGTIVLALLGRIRLEVRRLYPRDLRSWPLMGGVLFRCAHTDAHAILIMTYCNSENAIVGPDGGVRRIESGLSVPTEGTEATTWGRWMDEGRRELKIPEDGGFFVLPFHVVEAEVRALQRRHNPPDSPLLDVQVANNIAHHRRFLRIETAAPEEWRGRPMTFAEAGRLFGMSGTALRKRCAAASRERSAYYPLRPGGPGRFPNGKLRDDAVQYVHAQVSRAPEIARRAIEERKKAIRQAKAKNPIDEAALESEGLRQLEEGM